MLLVAALLVALFVLIGQSLALLPVGWWSPMLHFFPLEGPALGLATLRDVYGWWLLVPVALALVVGLVTLRRRRLPAVVTALSGLGVVLMLITTIVPVFAVHGETGQWFPFSPAAPVKSPGRGPDKTVTVATFGGQQLTADLYRPKTSSPASVPLVVSIHGGGFVAGSSGPTPVITWLADQGYAVFDVNYRPTRSMPAL